MSFYTNNKPKLVESKLVKYYYNKNRVTDIKQNDIKQTDIKQQLQITNPIEEYNIPIKKWYSDIVEYSWDFIKNNYGFVLISSLLIILLYIRYIEVTKRKDKIKDIINNINTESELNTENDVVPDTESDTNNK